MQSVTYIETFFHLIYRLEEQVYLTLKLCELELVKYKL